MIRAGTAVAVLVAAFAAGHCRGRLAERVPVPAPWEPSRSYGVLWRQRRGRRWHADLVTGGSLERALGCVQRLQAAGFAKACVVELHEGEQPMTSEPSETWEAPDGTCWFYFPPWREWTGWRPHEDGHWQLTVDEFRRSYPDAPPWDQL